MAASVQNIAPRKVFPAPKQRKGDGTSQGPWPKPDPSVWEQQAIIQLTARPDADPGPSARGALVARLLPSRSEYPAVF